MEKTPDSSLTVHCELANRMLVVSLVVYGSVPVPDAPDVTAVNPLILIKPVAVVGADSVETVASR